MEMLSAHPASDEAVALLDVVADPVRWSVLARLSETPRCECDLQAHIEIAPSLLSYHLKVLRVARLVTATRRGRWIDYTLAPDAHARLAAALPTAPLAP
jgi:ArsR family transcriptional regulator